MKETSTGRVQSVDWKDFFLPPSVSWTSPNVETTDSPLSDSVRKDSDLEHPTASITQPTEVRWVDLLQRIPEFYFFAVLCGIIYPIATADAVQSTLPRSQWLSTLERQQRWVKLTHLCTFCYIFLFLFNTTIVLVVINVPNEEKILLAVEWVCGSLPLILMYPAMMILRRNLYSPMVLYQTNPSGSSELTSTVAIVDAFEKGAEFQVYKEATLYGIKIGYQLLNIFVSLQVAYVIIQTSYTIGNSGNVSSILLSLSLVFDVLFTLSCTIAAVFLLVGVTAFLVIEQRLSFSYMIHLRTQAQQSTLEDSEYFATGLRMEARDRQSPMNVLFCTVALDSVICVVLLFYVSSVDFLSEQQLTYNVLYMLVIFAKDVWIFMLLLWQVLKVNEMVDVLLTQVARSLVSTSPQFTSNISLTTINTEINRDEKRLRRLELYLLMKEYKIGSTILFYRPSKVQLIVQMTSVAIGLISSLFKIIAKSIA